MRSAVGVLQLRSILAAFAFQVIKCDLIDFPRNTVAVVKSNVTISCKTNPIDSSVSWMFNTVSKQPGPDIYSFGNVNSIYQMKNMSVAKFDLTFASVRLDDAGVYTCQQVGNNNARAAWLNVVVNDPPLCWVADARNNNNIWNVTLGCSVEFNGTSSERNLLVPIASWSKCQPWLQSYTENISLPNNNDAYYRNFTSLAFLIFNASTTTNCAFSLSFRTYTTDSQQDSQDPLFVSQRVLVYTSFWLKVLATVVINNVQPLFGPASGGTKVTIEGQGLNVAHPTVTLNKSIVLSVKSVAFYTMIVETPPFNITGQNLPLTITYGTLLNKTFYFTFSYRPDPVIQSLYPTDHLAGGGTILTVDGTNFDSVAHHFIEITTVISTFDVLRNVSYSTSNSTKATCTVTDGVSTTMTCVMPALSLPGQFIKALNDDSTANRPPHRYAGPVATLIGDNGIDHADVYVGFKLDDLKQFMNISQVLPNQQLQFYLPPDIQPLKDLLLYDPSEGKPIAVQGKHLTRGCRLIDYNSVIGSSKCDNVQLTNNTYECRPPAERPDVDGNGTSCNQHLTMTIKIGFHSYPYACIDYRTSGSNLLYLLLLLLLIPLVVIIIVIVVLLVKRRRVKSMNKSVHS